jgi:carbonic anhydrase
MENNGHAIELTPPADKQLEAVLGGRRHKLLQFHYHAPSEHTLDEEFFPAEVHLVHEDLESLFFPPPSCLIACVELGGANGWNGGM